MLLKTSYNSQNSFPQQRMIWLKIARVLKQRHSVIDHQFGKVFSLRNLAINEIFVGDPTYKISNAQHLK